MTTILMLISAAMMFVGFISILEDDSDLGMYIEAIGFILLMFCVFGNIKCEKQAWIYNDKPYATEKIVSLHDNNMTNGKFYMRRGYIESDLYYQYMVDVGNGGYKANRVKSDKATLYHSDGNYRVEWCKKTKQWLWFKAEEDYYNIYIPEGSITDDYVVDLN